MSSLTQKTASPAPSVALTVVGTLIATFGTLVTFAIIWGR